MSAAAALACLALAAVAGCRGGEEDVAVAQTGPPGTASPGDPGPGHLLLDFVRAARRSDAGAMWHLLSNETQAGMGGTLARFRREARLRYTDQFELLAHERVVLSRVVGPYGVAAVAGLRRPDEGEEPEAYAYGAALVREPAGWRLELEGLAFARARPSPLEETDGRPVVGVRADAAGRVERLLVWLDGRPFRAPLTRELPFTAELEALPARPLTPGVHHVVAFAQGGGTAAALAWPFLVE